MKDAEDGLEIRHNFKLNTISAVAPANENLQFHIDLGSRTVLRLLVGTEQLRDDCVTEINDAVEKYKEAQKTLAVTNKVEETTEVEEVGDVKPVLFPNDLAENCQVRLFVFILSLNKDCTMSKGSLSKLCFLSKEVDLRNQVLVVGSRKTSL